MLSFTWPQIFAVCSTHLFYEKRDKMQDLHNVQGVLKMFSSFHFKYVILLKKLGEL